MKTLIIAEAGVNHNGDMELARRLIDIAADAGADMVKFQTFNAERLVTSQAKKAAYQISNTGVDESQYNMLNQLELSCEMHKMLIEHCQKRSIKFFSTAFDIESINLLDELGLESFKIPSGEITNLSYLEHIGSFGKPVILSTGMATMDEIGTALDILADAGTPRSKVTVLHCNTEYPTPMSDVNLRAMLNIKNTYNVDVGYSDHTLGIEVAIAAVALGAMVIEKHFTLNRNLPGPDHKASLTPKELKAMVLSIRNIEQSLGDGIKKPSKSEMLNRDIIRKSVIAACDIKKGELFSEDNLVVKRPGNGVSPMRWNEVIGHKASRDFIKDEMIEL